MSEPRTFSQRQRRALYLAAAGHCEMCGAELDAGWHADHVVPHSKGGATTIENGQALCPSCNQSKSQDMPGKITPRPFQQEALDRAITKFERGDDALVTVAAPGSGKTLMSQMVMNEIWKRGGINALLVLTPRVNLCQQFESDWRSDRDKLGGEVMGPILHVRTDPPLLGRKPNQIGVATTYQSAMEAPRLFKRLARSNRLGLIMDEAHRLGYDERLGGTRSHDLCKQLAEMANFSIIMTGTESRPDDRLVMPNVVEYSDKDEEGIRYMQPDVETRYIDGVRQGYLRRFEYEFVDGGAIREFVDGSEELKVSSLDSGLRDVMEAPGYWQPLCDKTAKRIEQSQDIHSSFCGLIGAARQDHAQQIHAYMESKHGLNAQLAVHDNSDAKNNLQKFREGEGDVLVTVGMAHVGFDHKPITVVCCLNHFRSYPWLFQFFARGLRVWDEVQQDRQQLRAIVPDDPEMRSFVEDMRSQSKRGIKERERFEGPGPPVPNDDPEISTIRDGYAGEVHTKGLNPKEDVETDLYEEIEEAASQHAPGVPLGQLKQFLSAVGAKPQPSGESPSQGTSSSEKSHLQHLEEWRNEINKKFRKIDSHMMFSRERADWEWGDAATEAVKEFGQGIPECKTIQGMRARKEWVNDVCKRIGLSITWHLPNE